MRLLPSRVGGIAVWATALLLAGAVGCKKGSSNPDGGDGPHGDGIQIEVGGETRDMGPDTPPCVAGAKVKGDACNCNAECTGGHCVDGVCCESACNEGCKTCAPAGMLGTCVNRTIGSNPRDAVTCKASAVASCGLDGKCDGMGGCGKYPVNTVCKAGTCEGDAVIGANVCDGSGQCKPGSTRICVPFSCNQGSGACYTTCTTNSQCVSGHQCVNGSCGPRMKGAACDKSSDCASGFCADGVCCNVACSGPCLSCNLMGREGTCWPLDADVADTRKICQDMGPSTCGQTGLCDGVGSCLKYARDTICLAATCSGNRRNTPGTCDGFGTCSPPGIQNCNPYRCANGACTTTCETNADCDIGIACVTMGTVKTCGPKQDGQTCTTSAECQHSHCVDGVCCDQACTGACRSCALSASLGRCMPIAAGTTDPRNMCAAMPQTTCGTNGKCDGSGGCLRWPTGTLCANEICNPTGNVYTAPATCSAAGLCVAQDPVACSPYKCNGTRCFNACTADNQCVPPNSCASNMCGPKELGASCSASDECRSQNCAQGVCCDTACNTACKSCIVGTLGICSNVATGAQDPHGICAMQLEATCGTNGRCEAGACQKWASGTPCLDATCPSTTDVSTQQSLCNGAGTCVTPSSTACFPYRCGPTACLASCTANTDCQPPAACVNGFCGLQPNGAICASKDECLSGFCEQGICCETACTGLCKSCALTASRGTCSNIPTGGADILSRCTDQGGPSCGTDGFCDGSGACRLYMAGAVCASPSCPTGQSTQVSGRTCNGVGVCQPATTLACNPYVCNGTSACFSVCTGDGDCLAGNICDPITSKCGNVGRLGSPCTSNTMCLTGNYCVDGVCCSTSSCPLCQACNVGSGAAGNCANVPAGTPDSMNRCTANPPCGNTGFCNGAGACQLAATTVSCGTQSCTGSTFTPISHCNGSGGCAAPTASSCTPFVCGPNACLLSCTVDTDCLAPFTCQGSAPKSCARKPNGQACSAGNQCISGNCINGVCCGSSVCGTCQTCNGTAPGTCTALALGTPAPTGQCAASPPCGNTGFCDGASGCQQGLTTTSCGAAVSCTGTTFQPQSFCSGGGSCTQAATMSCGNYICGASACLTTCTADTDCASTSLYCTGAPGAPGSCVTKKANGITCVAGKECGNGNCVDGFCCMTSSCPACQSCNNTAGMCTNVQDGTSDPPNCAANPPCGNTGLCVGGACQQAASTVTCGTAVSCTGTTYQPQSHCTGTGTCSQASTSSCSPLICNQAGTACLPSCNNNDNDCVGGYYCTGTGGSCMIKNGLGVGCNANHECALGNCVDGVCCMTSSCPACQSCNNAAGTCANVQDGTSDPPNCAANPPCGNTGFCVGGACQQQPGTTSCGLSQSCTGTTYQPPSHCTGTGMCNQTSTSSCGSYICGASSCLNSCTSDSDCSDTTNLFCNGSVNNPGSCVSKNPNGTDCNANHECQLGNCVDGVCCGAGSCGPCQACNVAGSKGTCADVPDGQYEPHSRCAPNGNCGNTGYCTGGACTQVASGMQCSGFFCPGPTNHVFQPGGSCNGSGTCVIPSSVDCTPYNCTTGSCFSQCNNNNQCVSTAYCTGNMTTNGSCVAKGNLGDPCANDNECLMGHCTEGVCCNMGTCGQCQSCVVTGMVGMCNYVPVGGADPTGTCMNTGAASCGTTGLCGMGGNCQVYDINTQCLTSCDGVDFTHTYCGMTGMCDGAMVTDLCPTMTCTAAGCDP